MKCYACAQDFIGTPIINKLTNNVFCCEHCAVRAEGGYVKSSALYGPDPIVIDGWLNVEQPIDTDKK